jgi:hypothetical protein
VRHGERRFVGFGTNANHELSIDDAHTHVAAHQKREPAEHFPFDDVVGRIEHRARPLC